jgi:hypothetical protein
MVALIPSRNTRLVGIVLAPASGVAGAAKTALAEVGHRQFL